LYESGCVDWRVATFFGRGYPHLTEERVEVNARVQSILEVKYLGVYVALKVRHPFRTKPM